jgi:hypothetical protein
MSFKSLLLLNRVNMVIWNAQTRWQEEICEAYMMGNQKGIVFTRGYRVCKGTTGTIVHTDLCGSMRTEPIGLRNTMSAIVDCLKKTLIYFLKVKSDAFKTFLRFPDKSIRQSVRKLRCLLISLNLASNT